MHLFVKLWTENLATGFGTAVTLLGSLYKARVAEFLKGDGDGLDSSIL